MTISLPSAFYRILFLVPMLIIPTFLCSCDSPQNASALSSSPPPFGGRFLERTEPQIQRALVCLVDRSGSILDSGRETTRALQEVADLVPHLPPATVMSARYIASNSYNDQELVVLATIPVLLPTVLCNSSDIIFNRRKKKECFAAQQQAQQRLQNADGIKKTIVATLKGSVPARATHTDLWGAIVAASEELEPFSEAQRTILIYSDLADTMGVALPDKMPGLAGVQILVRTVKRDTPRNVWQRLSTFRDRLSSFGAIVVPIPLEVPVDANKIFVSTK